MLYTMSYFIHIMQSMQYNAMQYGPVSRDMLDGIR